MFFLLLPVDFRVCVSLFATGRFASLQGQPPSSIYMLSATMRPSVPNRCLAVYPIDALKIGIACDPSSLFLFCEPSTFFRRHSLWRCLLPMSVPAWVLLATVESRLWNCPEAGCAEECPGFSRAGCAEALFLLRAGISPRRSTPTESCRVEVHVHVD